MKRGLLYVSAILVISLFLSVLPFAAMAQTGQQGTTRQPDQQKALNKTLQIQSRGATVRYPEGWITPPRRFANADELIYAPRENPSGAAAAGSAALKAFPARIMITTERGQTHADALRRLKEIEAEESSPSTFLNIGGWPALQRRHIAPRPRPGKQDRQAQESGALILRITTAIAADNLLIRLEGSVPPEAAAEIAGQIEVIGRNLTFETKGDPGQVEREIEQLRTGPSLRSSLQNPGDAAPRNSPGGGAAAPQIASPSVTNPTANQRRDFTPLPKSAITQRQDLTPFAGPLNFSDISPGVAQRVLTGGSEIEVAVTPNGQNIVIGTNSGYTFSTNGGITFTTRSVPFPAGFFRMNGDPSLAVGRSGNFYQALIGFPTGTASTNTATTNSTAIFVSTNNGQNFNFQASAVVCNGLTNFNNGSTTFPNMGDCFADQEHIAADRFNVGTGGGDQVYSTWRNFDATDADPALVCSQDGGQNWTAPANVGAGGIPRITIGQDGNVYVVYRAGNNIMLQRYNSCANGLAAQGMPSMVASVTDVCTERLPGIDRCDGRNSLSSHMVAVDDTDATHVFVAYATHTAAGNENIFVRDSTNSGAMFPPGNVVQVNAAVNGRRFMPWVCAIGGTAHVTWYDRRAATASSNDLTDFFRGSATRSGGSLVSGAEVSLTDRSDPHCQTGFPCSSDSSNDAETCSAQPQNWGICKRNPVPNPDTSSNTPCDFNQTTCPMGETCVTFGGGCPKYGDYNGNACAAGRIYSAWAASTSPSNISPATPSNRIDTFFDSTIVCCVPQIQAPSNINFPPTCAGTTAATTMKVCNTGLANLVVSSIASSNSQFTVPASYPVTIAPGACFDFDARFTPTSMGLKSATLTINSNDPVTPLVTVLATGSGKELQTIACPPDMTVITAKPGDPGIIVNYPAPTIIDSSCATSVVASKPSGSIFPPGETTVTITATDTLNRMISCSFKVTVWDVCLQDDKTGDFLRINSFTGDYQFTRCGVGGFTMTGKGRISRDHYVTKLVDDSRVVSAEFVGFPPGIWKGDVTIKRFGVIPYVLKDTNILNNTCVCP